MQVHYKDRIRWLGKILGEAAGMVRAVDGVDVAVYRDETLAVVGESGSGKTTLGRTILRLEQPTAGEVSVEGQNITRLPQPKIRPLRARMQMIFMYLGRIVEIGETAALFDQPRHPYTEALLSAVALPDPRRRENQKRIVLEGKIPSPRNPPSGCPFHPRCRYPQPRCTTDVPVLTPLAGGSRLASCHFASLVGIAPASPPG